MTETLCFLDSFLSEIELVGTVKESFVNQYNGFNILLSFVLA